MFYSLLISHLLLDYGYALSGSMLLAKSKGSPYSPILLHSALQATGVALVLLAFGVNPTIILIAFHFELITHFLIDLGKGKVQGKYPELQDSKNPLYWHLFQVDQFLHITVKYIIALCVI